MTNRVDKANKVTWAGLVINVILTVFKLFAGMFGKSGAMIADAFHSLSDFATDVVVLFGFRFVGKPADKSHDYGHGKIETLLSVVIGAVLCVVGVRIFWTAGQSIFNIYHGKSIQEPGWIAVYAAIISIIVKESLYRYTIKAGREINSQVIIANAWHHRSDAFSSIGTMFGIGGAILLGEKWHILDPVAAIIVSFFIIRTAINISLGGFNELMEASLSDEVEHKILESLKIIPGVIFPHNLKTRRIGNYIAIEVHIKVDKTLDITAAHDISTKCETKLKEKFGEETFTAVHIEPAS